MPSLSETLARLATAQSKSGAFATHGVDRLTDFTGFGTDPGNLRARCYVPEDLPRGAPLVVVLHGCTQSAAGYDQGSGWSTLADRHGFALLYPEQRGANNPNRCFNWFVAEQITRGGGEALSIRQMVAQMVATHAIDPARVFITGLSAGGAMTMVMLATYPELFTGGAVIAGLPYGTATGVGPAMTRMRGGGLPAARELVGIARAAAPVPARWPTLSVWHGTADQTVAPANMDAIVAQWAGVQDIALDRVVEERVAGHQRRRWINPRGGVQIEAYAITDMGHGTPIDPHGADACGTAMPFMLPVGLCSTSHIAATWGIADAVPRTRAAEKPGGRGAAGNTAPAGVTRVISDALRAAGLMR